MSSAVSVRLSKWAVHLSAYSVRSATSSTRMAVTWLPTPFFSHLIILCIALCTIIDSNSHYSSCRSDHKVVPHHHFETACSYSKTREGLHALGKLVSACLNPCFCPPSLTDNTYRQSVTQRQPLSFTGTPPLPVYLSEGQWIAGLEGNACCQGWGRGMHSRISRVAAVDYSSVLRGCLSVECVWDVRIWTHVGGFARSGRLFAGVPCYHSMA
jgi:hypothetical protein